MKTSLRHWRVVSLFARVMMTSALFAGLLSWNQVYGQDLVVQAESGSFSDGADEAGAAGWNLSADGGSIVDPAPTPGFDSVADHATSNYKLNFSAAGDYSLYYHFTLFDVDGDGGYGNNDSFYLPVSLNAPIVQAGRSNLDDGAGDGTFEGNFQWMKATLEDGSDASYSVSGAMVGSAVDFQLGTRENGAGLDAMIFSTDGNLSAAELDVILPEPATILLLLLGFGGIGLIRRRRSR